MTDRHSTAADEQLRARLARLDPADRRSPSPVPSTSPRAQELLESVMTSTAPTTNHPSSRRRTTLLAGAAGLVAAASAGVLLLQGGSTQSRSTELALALAPSNVMSSCVMFDVALLKGMSPAFAGTVTALDGGQVRLQVDRWYTGGDAQEVVLQQPDPGSSASLDGVAFEVGTRYLVTAAEGVVNGCGYSGEATPELEKAFDDAFGGAPG